LTDADRAAATPPSEAHPMHDDALQSLVMFNRLEGFEAGAGAGLAWEARAWLGPATDRLWLRSEGERVAGRTEHADVELLYGRAITPWWELLAGVRHDDAPGPARDFVAVGVQGLAPYKIEVQATAYLGPSGQTAARIELEYKTLLTNRLILQPLVEAEFHGQDDPRRGIGAGLGQVEAGLRLRYELSRRFAPYVGVVHGRAFGRTADMRRARGEADEDTHLVAGVRLWF
jgi:copper resistance protein B